MQLRSNNAVAIAAAVVLATGGSGLAHAQQIPASILGQWRIQRILPTRNPKCWDPKHTKGLVGSTMTYRQHAMTWQGGVEPITAALSRNLSRRQFRTEYSVELAELGIASANITEIDLQHEDADITGSTTEVPGDTILLAGDGRIVVSACGVFYSATRLPGRPAANR